MNQNFIKIILNVKPVQNFIVKNTGKKIKKRCPHNKRNIGERLKVKPFKEEQERSINKHLQVKLQLEEEIKNIKLINP